MFHEKNSWLASHFGVHGIFSYAATPFKYSSFAGSQLSKHFGIFNRTNLSYLKGSCVNNVSQPPTAATGRSDSQSAYFCILKGAQCQALCSQSSATLMTLPRSDPLMVSLHQQLSCFYPMNSFLFYP